MLRVKDAEKSLKFYQEVLGMSLFRKHEVSAAEFNLYFLGYPGEKGVPSGDQASREGILELTWYVELRTVHTLLCLFRESFGSRDSVFASELLPNHREGERYFD